MCKHTWYEDEIYFVRQHNPRANTSALEWVVSQHAVLTMSCQHQINECRQNKHTMNWSDKHVLLKWKERHSLLTRNRSKELEKTFVLCVLAQAGHLKFRFRHGTRCAFHISILPTSSHTCLGIRTVQIDTGDGTYSHFGPHPLICPS